MKKRITKLIVLVAAMTMMLASMTVFASAKTIKPKYCGIVSLKTLTNNSTPTAANMAKKAATVKKGKTTINIPTKNASPTIDGKVVKVAVGQFALKFTAPKSKTYTFTVSNEKVKGGNGYANGSFNTLIKHSDGVHLYALTCQTEGGYTNEGLKFASRLSQYRTTMTSYLPKRSAKVSLSQGQTVYLWFMTMNGKSVNVQIK